MTTSSQPNSRKEKIGYISLASVLGSVAVVYLHANACFWTFSNALPYWKSANIVEGVFYFAMPLFLMITGATLIDFRGRYGFWEYLRRRVAKAVIPYVFWSLAALLFQMYVIGDLKPGEVKAIDVLNGLLAGNIVYYYYFFIHLFAAYLTIPLFAFVPDRHRKKLFSYIVLISFVFNALIPFVIDMSGYQVNYNFSVAAGSDYLLFILAGYLISHYEMKPVFRFVMYVLGIAGLAVKTAGTYILSMSAGVVVEKVSGYTNVPCILYVCGVFVFIKYAGAKLMRIRWLSRLVETMSKYTLGYFLLHWFIFRLITAFTPMNIFSPVYRFLMPVPVIIVMTGIIWLIRRIPVLKHTLPV